MEEPNHFYDLPGPVHRLIWPHIEEPEKLVLDSFSDSTTREMLRNAKIKAKDITWHFGKRFFIRVMFFQKRPREECPHPFVWHRQLVIYVPAALMSKRETRKCTSMQDVDIKLELVKLKPKTRRSIKLESITRRSKDKYVLEPTKNSIPAGTTAMRMMEILTQELFKLVYTDHFEVVWIDPKPSLFMDCFLWKMNISFRCIYFNCFKSANGNQVTRMLQHIQQHKTDTMFINLKVVKSPVLLTTPFMNQRSVSLETCNFITMDALMNSSVADFTIKSKNFGFPEVNVFIKKWLNGELESLREFNAKLPYDRTLFTTVALSGIEYVEMPIQRRFYDPNHQIEVEIFRPSDNKRAVVRHMGMIIPEVEFIVREKSAEIAHSDTSLSENDEE